MPLIANSNRVAVRPETVELVDSALSPIRTLTRLICLSRSDVPALRDGARRGALPADELGFVFEYQSVPDLEAERRQLAMLLDTSLCATVSAG